MKPEKQLNIAVCLSTQSRTWKTGAESLLKFFSSPTHKYYFFGHTWDKNSWKPGYHREYVIEQLNVDELRKSVLETIPFSGLQIDVQSDTPCVHPRNEKIFYTWLPMLKSFMLANNLKTQYEVDNDMTFDLVVHTRWDLAYQPGTRFEPFIPDEIMPDALYCHNSYFQKEFRMPCIDDILYFGSSRTLDIVDSFYHYYSTDRFFELVNQSCYNTAFFHVGCGVLLHKWSQLKNLKMIEIRHKNFGNGIYPAVIRQNATDYKWPEEHDKIVEAYKAY